MGALHEGHARLIETCSHAQGCTVVSIFVNPTQFGPNEDYLRYPRSPDQDRALCSLAGASLIFAPEVSTIYPPGFSGTCIEVPGLSSVLEGSSRPGHFRAVETVVMKLLQIARPDAAYFGQKDYQQLLLIQTMSQDLNLEVEIKAVPTVREPDGLALSSRNRYLNPEERRAATVLYRALSRASELAASGETRADRVRQVLADTVKSELEARLDYAEVADAATLAPVSLLSADRPSVALVAAWVGPARLIDNAFLPTSTRG
jgi:pantoate--beta-alanine ligase